MNKNENYKDSGVEWIGKIPKHWEMSKIKYNSDVQTGSTPKSKVMSYWNGKIRWYTPTDFKSVDKKRFLKQPARFITQEGLSNSACSFIDKDAILLTTRAPVGNVGKIKKNFTFNQGCKSLTPRANLDISYLYFYLKTVTKPLNMIANGTTFTELSIQNLLNFEIPLPLPEEQILISRYLDKKTEQIDSLIDKIQKKMELLKEQRTSLINQCVTKGLDPNVEMKDSGVEWIGEIPKHWSISRLKYIGEITLGKMLTPVDKGGMVLLNYLRNMNVQEGYLNLTNLNKMWFLPQEINKLSIRQGDILVSEGGQVGRPCFIEKDIENIGFQNSINRVRTSKVNPKFLYLLILSNFKRGYYDSIVERVSIPHLTKEKLENSLMILPPQEEQKLIAHHLTKKTKQLDAFIEKIQKKIELLKEYRQSLISSVVTGKIRITENML